VLFNNPYIRKAIMVREEKVGAEGLHKILYLAHKRGLRTLNKKKLRLETQITELQSRSQWNNINRNNRT